jgi:hypothetical protein
MTMRVVNIKRSRFTHYIGRPSLFGNPLVIGRDGDRDFVIAMFEDMARRDPSMRAAIEVLPKDAVLGCYCKPLACHGDVIVKLWKEMHS